jgi:hypothetical protein
MGSPLEDALSSRSYPTTGITASCYHPQQDGDGGAKTEEPPPIVQIQIATFARVISEAMETLDALETRLDKSGVLAPKKLPKPGDEGEVPVEERIAPIPVPMAERLRGLSCQIMFFSERIDALIKRLGV